MQATTIIKVSNTEALKLTQNKQCVLLDVREPSEHNAEHVPWAQLVPLTGMESNLATLDKNQAYLTMCGGGGRATKAAEKMLAAGFKNVRIVDGGFRGWKASGLETKAGTPSDKSFCLTKT